MLMSRHSEVEDDLDLGRMSASEIDSGDESDRNLRRSDSDSEVEEEAAEDRTSTGRRQAPLPKEMLEPLTASSQQPA